MAIDIYSQIKRLRDTCVYVCVALCMLGRGGEPGRIRNVGAAIRVGARSYL